MNRNGCDIIYISHGGGPLPLLGDKSHEKMVKFLETLSKKIKKPEEILVISAHWEEDIPTIYSSEKQDLLFDYYGFPAESYEIKYPTKQNPKLIAVLQESLQKNDIPSRLDTARGLDHGVFIPLMLMYPDGEIPVTQLSLKRGLEPDKHIILGKALKSLFNRNILVIGSGFSFHNLRAFTMSSDEQEDAQNNDFQDWLIHACTQTDEEQCFYKLENWTDAPGARYCHPREEHLLPLHVCAGLAGSKAEVIFDDYIAGKRSVAFRW